MCVCVCVCVCVISSYYPTFFPHELMKNLKDFCQHNQRCGKEFVFTNINTRTRKMLQVLMLLCRGHNK